MSALVKVVTGPYAMPNGHTYATGDVVALSDTQRAGMTAGDFPAKVLDVTVTTATGTAAVSSVDSLTGAVTLTSRYARRGDQPYARGQLVLILDDVRLSQYQIALPYVEAAGGKVTLACNWNAVGASGVNMAQGQLLDAYTRGHEIACHSLSHPDMTSLTSTTRTAEWDTSKASIEAVIGAGTVKSWVYPVNTNNLTCDQEAYLRYDRIFAGGYPPSLRPVGDRSSFLTGRFAWNDSTHAAALAALRIAAKRDVTFVVYTHDVDGTNPTGGVTQVHFQELIDLASALGVQMVTAAQGCPAHNPVPDGGFEDTTLASWTLATVGTGTITSVADTPSAGLTGTNSLQIVGDGTAGGQSATTQANIPLTHPTENYTVSCRAHHNRSSGSGSTILIVKEYDQYGAMLQQNNGGAISVGGSQPWQQLTCAFTPQATTRSVQITCSQSSGFAGTSWFDHVHSAPTRYGVLG